MGCCSRAMNPRNTCDMGLSLLCTCSLFETSLFLCCSTCIFIPPFHHPLRHPLRPSSSHLPHIPCPRGLIRAMTKGPVAVALLSPSGGTSNRTAIIDSLWSADDYARNALSIYLFRLGAVHPVEFNYISKPPVTNLNPPLSPVALRLRSCLTRM